MITPPFMGRFLSEATGLSNDINLSDYPPFVLRNVHYHGLRCSNSDEWYRLCKGCPIPFDSTAHVLGVSSADSKRAQSLQSVFGQTERWACAEDGSAGLINDGTIAIDWNPVYAWKWLKFRELTRIEDDYSVTVSRNALHRPLTFADSMAAFTSPEVMSGNDQLYCSKCKTHENGTLYLSMLH